MLRPGLGDGLEFNIGQVTAFALAVGADGLHLGQVECSVALSGEGQQGLIREAAQAEGFDRTARYTGIALPERESPGDYTCEMLSSQVAAL